MSRAFDALIIGAGIMGCSIAYGLAQRGRSVLVVDKNPAAGYGSTSSSAAIIRTFYSTRGGCALAWEGLHCWRDWDSFLGLRDERGQARFVPCASVVLCNGEPDGMDTTVRHFDALGIPYEAWDIDELVRRLPYLDARKFAPLRRHQDPDFGRASGERLTGAIHMPNSGYVTDPQQATRNLEAAARSKGAEFRFGARFTEVVMQGNRVAGVRLDDREDVAASIVVNAAGPYSSTVNRMAGVESGMTIKTRALRQELSHIPGPKDVAIDVIIGDPDIACYLRPETGGALLVGTTQPDCDPFEWVDDPDHYNRNFTEQWTTQVHRQALRIPSLGIPGRATGVIDLYDVTPDWTPIYDCSDVAGFYMAVGTSGNQFKNGPVAGQLMAGLIDYCEAGNDHDRAPYRFPLPRTGGELDVSAFSRRRPVGSGAGVFG